MRRTWHRLAGVAVAVAAAGLVGCNIVGPAAYFIGGPAKVPPQYVLPKDQSAVVFIDDRANVLPSRAARQRVAKSAERTLLDGKAVGKGDIIGSDAILSFASQERFGKPTGIAEVGQAVNAATVIYATVDSFGLSPDGVEYAPFASARVKVVDSKSRRRLWPGADREWANVEFRSPTRVGSAPTTNAERINAENRLAENLGIAIARLFVEYVPEDVAKRVGE